MRMRHIITALASVLALVVSAAPAAAAAPGDASPAAQIGFERSAATAGIQMRAVAGELTIQVGNSTSATFDELALFFNRFSNPASQLQARFNFAPGEVEVFTLADCQDINAFAIGLFIDGELVINTGDIEPDRDLCIENIAFIEN